MSYEAPDEEEEAIAKQAHRETTPDRSDDVDSAIGGSPKATQSDESSSDASDSEDSDAEAMIATAKELEDRIKDKTPSVNRFAFDSQGAQWCEIDFEYNVSTGKLLLLPLVEAACHDAVIQSIPHIGACTYTKEDFRNPETKKMEEIPVIMTQGVNLKAMHDFQDIINPHRIFTNDIWAMMTVYGVEAGEYIPARILPCLELFR